jgi:conjugal transfer pilus assembly protein TraU
MERKRLNKKVITTLAIILSLILSAIKPSYSATAPEAVQKAVCGVKPDDAVKIWTTLTATLYNVFPIRIGGVQIMSVKGLEDYKSTSSMPICICMDPLPRVGIKISLWEPRGAITVTKVPWCEPIIGAAIPVNFGPGALAVGQNEGDTGTASGKGEDKKEAAFQVHYWKFPVMGLLQLFIDVACLSPSGIDLAWNSEVDFTWQSDVWAAILNPEAALVANPVAQLACSVDSVTANFGFPLDPLFWCMGSRESVYPFTQKVQTSTYIDGMVGIAERIIYKLHRQGMLWGSVGEAGLCKEFPMPIWRKSQYGLFPVYPIVFPKRQPVGRSSVMWGITFNIPVKQRLISTFAVYRKRDCCAF